VFAGDASDLGMADQTTTPDGELKSHRQTIKAFLEGAQIQKVVLASLARLETAKDRLRSL
jgi:hypothetical protein